MQIPVEFLSMTKEAAVLARGNTVVYANSAAEQLFKTECVGKSLSELFGEEIAAAQAGSFVAGTALCGKSCIVRSMVLDGMHILVFSPADVLKPELNSAFINALNSSLMNISLSLTSGFNLLDEQENNELFKCLTDIHKDYYRLRRLSSNINIVGNFVSGALPFVPRADDLSAFCRRFFSIVSDMFPDIDFKLSIPEGIVISFDHSLIMCALTNLVSNCLCHGVGCDTISFSMIESGSLVMFSITDNGCGISPELTATMFERFKSASALCGSSGLGLTAVRAAAEKHGGTLLIESREGRGTSVRFSISSLLHGGKDCLSSAGIDCFPVAELYTGLADVLPPEMLS